MEFLILLAIAAFALYFFVKWLGVAGRKPGGDSGKTTADSLPAHATRPTTRVAKNLSHLPKQHAAHGADDMSSAYLHSDRWDELLVLDDSGCRLSTSRWSEAGCG